VQITNYDDVRQFIVERLEMLRDVPNRFEFPAIYHLDVGAMYPNIILTNRLQPSAMVSQHDCAACDFNRSENMCKRPMVWTWRGDYTPASQAEYQSVKRQLTYEKGGQSFDSLTERQQAELVADRLKAYSNRVYKKSKATSIVDKVSTVCMRENPFYVNTVRAFRDRRYDYKLLTKQWKGKKTQAEAKNDLMGRKLAEDKEVLMDSLQLAHKCILNSFYGYVMRKGARWRSMEMAGIVTKTGAELIKQARELVEQVGRPLELDTDGIWCILPSSFPQKVSLKTVSGKLVSFEYPCAMLNADIHDRYTNHQYQDLATGSESADPSRRYVSHSECSIYFELDGPYKAMVLPASPEEGKLLKKKYVVFNEDGTIAELKGFELKRRGELEIVKAFQSQVFSQFLSGSTLLDCYEAVGSIANRWLDVLDSRGLDMDDDELLQLISERKTISKTLEDYGNRKATSLTSAARLADFLGAEMVKDKGLNCNLIISRFPLGDPVAERAIPVVIFSADESIRRYYLRKWLKDPSFECNNFRDVVDWDYYKSRLSGTIQKIVTIPAGMQNIPNPCARVEHPAWLLRNLNDSSGLKQQKITSMFSAFALKSKTKSAAVMDPPDVGTKAPKLIASSPGKVIKGETAEDDALIGTGTSIMLSPAGKLKKTVQQSTPESNKKRNLFGTPQSTTSDKKSITVIDIEDIAGTPSKSGRPVVHFKNKLDQAINAVFDMEADDSLTTPLSPSMIKASPKAVNEISPLPTSLIFSYDMTKHELSSWLESRKTIWKNKRQARKMHSKALTRSENSNKEGVRGAGNHFYVGNIEDGSMKKRPISVADFVRSAALSATQGMWQILEFQETEGPGEFVVWAMTTGTQLQRFKVTVPRILYLNCQGNNAEATAHALQGVRVRRDLPHARVCNGLFEVKMSERKYVRNEKGLNTYLGDAQMEGVYESQTPLWFRAVLKTGCVARLANVTDGKSNQYKLHDLEFISSQSHPYLDPSAMSIRQIFLYNVVDKTRSNGFAGIGLFIVEGSSFVSDDLQQHELLSGKAQCWIANGGYNLDSRPPMQKIYRKYQPDTRAVVKFSTSFVSNVGEGFRLCNEALTTYLREKHGPTLVVAQGSFDSKHWRKNVPALSEFPLTTVPANNQDELFPALGWQIFLAERMIQRFLIYPRWLKDRLQCARHSHIPLCMYILFSLVTALPKSNVYVQVT
jgi:DNA polymerase elongation subunit (family B)